VVSFSHLQRKGFAFWIGSAASFWQAPLLSIPTGTKWEVCYGLHGLKPMHNHIAAASKVMLQRDIAVKSR